MDVDSRSPKARLDAVQHMLRLLACWRRDVAMLRSAQAELLRDLRRLDLEVHDLNRRSVTSELPAR